MHVFSVREMEEQLRALGVRAGGVLLVDASFRAVRPVEGGPLGLIEALRRSVGDDGTLVMPAMTDGETVFDPASTPERRMRGVRPRKGQHPRRSSNPRER